MGGPSVQAPTVSAGRHPPSLHPEVGAGLDLQGLGCPLVAMRLQLNLYPNLEIPCSVVK